MAKISIHIPDETLAKVREHKDRMNISRICSRALLREVETLAEVPPLVEETHQLIERLRQETQGQQLKSFDLGVRLATSYLDKTSFEQLSYWGNLTFSEKKKLILPEEIEDFIEDAMMEKRICKFHRPSFSKGWLSIMNRTWETVKDKA